MFAVKSLFENIIQNSKQLTRNINTTIPLNHVQFTTRMKIVDNSKLAQEGTAWRRSPRIIHVYTKTRVATLGDKVLLAIKGQKQKAIVVGCKNKIRKANVPNFDTNNCVLIDDQGNPLGTRITAPIPSLLRRNEECAKILAIATRFI